MHAPAFSPCPSAWPPRSTLVACVNGSPLFFSTYEPLVLAGEEQDAARFRASFQWTPCGHTIEVLPSYLLLPPQATPYTFFRRRTVRIVFAWLCHAAAKKELQGRFPWAAFDLQRAIAPAPPAASAAAVLSGSSYTNRADGGFVRGAGNAVDQGEISNDLDEEELEELFGEIGGEFTVPELSPETKAMMEEAGLVDTMNAARPAQRMAEVGPWNSGAF